MKTRCWIPWNRLKAMDAQEASSDMYCIIDEELRAAYAEASEWYGNTDLSYWKDKIFAKQLQKDIGSQPKRKISALGFKYPPEIDMPPILGGSIETEENESLFVEDEDNIGRDKKKESRKRLKSNGGSVSRPPVYQGIMEEDAYFLSGEPSNPSPKDDQSINPG